MKTNKTDIRLLKSKHRLELVMQATGESFEVDAANSDLWRSVLTRGLTVDIRRQTYEIQKPGMEPEAGDVLTWLQSRFQWSFPMAITYLKKRAPDPRQETMPAPKETERRTPLIDESKVEALDAWQEKALLICGKRIEKYFSWTWNDLAMLLDETRIEPVHAPEVATCPRCGKKINWYIEKSTTIETDPWGNILFEREHQGPIPVLAYSIKRRMTVSDLGLEGSQYLTEVFTEAKISGDLQEKITKAVANSFDGLVVEAGNLFVEEEDGVVCAKCAWGEYDFQVALKLCRTSAIRREKAEQQERIVHDREEREREREEADREEREREREEARLWPEAEYTP